VSGIDQQLAALYGIFVPLPPSFRLLSMTESIVLSLLIRKEHHMSEAYIRPDPSLIPIERPRCPKCQGRTMLTRIEPGPDSSDLRTFECSKCEHVYKVQAEDPTKPGVLHAGFR
jgi:hypothetical protein